MHWRFASILDLTEEQIFDYGLYLIERLLLPFNVRPSKYGLPDSQMDWAVQELESNPFMAEQLDYNPDQEGEMCEQNTAKFNEGQRSAYERICDSVDHNKGELFFLVAPGGCGKTFLSNTLTHRYRAARKIVLCVVASGIASLLLIGGRTVHSRFKVPIIVHEGTVCSISKSSQLAELLCNTDLIICDEVLSQHYHVQDAVDCTLRDLRNCDKPFGGITTVWSGDPRQCLPVVPRGTRQEIIGATIMKSTLWREVKILHLTQNMRLDIAPEDVIFAKWLLEVGEGLHTTEDTTIELPAHMCCGDSLEALLTAIYPDLPRHGSSGDDFFSERAILTSRNADVLEINEHLLRQFPGEIQSFVAADTVKLEAGADSNVEDTTTYPPEYLASLFTSGLPLSKLKLKRVFPS